MPHIFNVLGNFSNKPAVFLAGGLTCAVRFSTLLLSSSSRCHKLSLAFDEKTWLPFKTARGKWSIGLEFPTQTMSSKLDFQLVLQPRAFESFLSRSSTQTSQS
jgi:hypothetical protein